MEKLKFKEFESKEEEKEWNSWWWFNVQYIKHTPVNVKSILANLN